MVNADDIHDQLMGTAEVAEYVGKTSQTIAGYLAKKGAGIPQPIARLKCGPIWFRPDIEAWARARGYIGGEPVEQ